MGKSVLFLLTKTYMDGGDPLGTAWMTVGAVSKTLLSSGHLGGVEGSAIPAGSGTIQEEQRCNGEYHSTLW